MLTDLVGAKYTLDKLRFFYIEREGHIEPLLYVDMTYKILHKTLVHRYLAILDSSWLAH